MPTVWRGDYHSWDPSYITTSLWLDAADTDTITESGGAVSQWDDKSGNNKHAVQGTTALQPVYTASSLINSKPAIDFTSARSTELVTPTIANNSIAGNLPISLFGVFYNRYSTSTYQSPIGTRLSGGSWWTFLRPAPGPSIEIGFHDLSQRWSGSSSVGQGAIIGWTVSSADLLSIFLDGTLSYQIGCTAFKSNIDSAMRIGVGSQNSTNEDYEGLIGEIVFFTSEITSEIRQKIEGYLAHKWGLTASLPGSHPYKTIPPAP